MILLDFFYLYFPTSETERSNKCAFSNRDNAGGTISLCRFKIVRKLTSKVDPVPFLVLSHPSPIVLKLSFPKYLFLEIFDCTKNYDTIIPKIFDMFDFAKNGTIPEPVMRKILSRKFAQEVIIYYSLPRRLSFIIIYMIFPLVSLPLTPLAFSW